ncbi:hypothetical protein ACIBI9_55215 [Nonomuraea sp. NPDC050451]|uniref:hypothetical protein n=1 Tax=Nonomuraea sp. NPDC050451 TaxID=3364364 RepID=UPI0037AB4A25
MGPSDVIATVAAVIAVASLLYARRSAIAAVHSAKSSARSANAAARSADADELSAVQQARIETDSGRVKVYVSLEPAQPWELNYRGSLIYDLSPFEFTSEADFKRNWLQTPIRGILVNEDTRTVVIADRWSCRGGSTPLCREPIPEPMSDHRGVLVPPGDAVIFETAIGGWTERWRELWVEDNLEKLWSRGPSTTLRVWAAQEGDGVNYAAGDHQSPPSGWEIRIGVYDWALEPSPKEDPDSLTWYVRGTPSFIVTRSPYRPSPKSIHELTEPDNR